MRLNWPAVNAMVPCARELAEAPTDKGKQCLTAFVAWVMAW